MLAFDADLRELAAEIVEMANQTEKQVSNSLDALLSKNVGLAREVKTADEAIDELRSTNCSGQSKPRQSKPSQGVSRWRSICARLWGL
jgi:PhoU domain